MPSRTTTLIIVACWLAVGGWWVRRELLPWLDPGEPPPFTIDLADEIRPQGMRIDWTIYRGEQRLGSVVTQVRYEPADGSFELEGRFGLSTETVADLRLHSRLGIDRRFDLDQVCQLRSLYAHVTGKLVLPGGSREFEAELSGRVEGDRLQPRGWIEAEGRHLDLRLAAVDVPPQRGLLNPLHPVNRVLGLRPGQTWQQPTLDPFEALLSGLVLGAPPPRPQWIRAAVQPRPEVLTWGGREVPCLVVHYFKESDMVYARCWVRQGDGLVLRQEVVSGSLGNLVLLRNP